jgi:hypothetical protein
VLGNKSDLPDKIGVDELIEAMNLEDITNREVSCYSISAKEETNLDAVLQWLIARAKRWRALAASGASLRVGAGAEGVRRVDERERGNDFDERIVILILILDAQA